MATNVNAGTITSSPGPMSNARKINCSASVPLATPMQCGTPQSEHREFSLELRHAAQPENETGFIEHGLQRRVELVQRIVAY